MTGTWTVMRDGATYVTEKGRMRPVFSQISHDYEVHARHNDTHKINTLGSEFPTIEDAKAFIEKEYREKGENVYD